mmetsp:Transcript_32938/g.93344  ORF Transcript_32938/g.93344 Transcript_32938/m.93344 type:complete len:288 (-) Transcript_32938:503-1366(-)
MGQSARNTTLSCRATLTTRLETAKASTIARASATVPQEPSEITCPPKRTASSRAARGSFKKAANELSRSASANTFLDRREHRGPHEAIELPSFLNLSFNASNSSSLRSRQSGDSILTAARNRCSSGVMNTMSLPCQVSSSFKLSYSASVNVPFPSAAYDTAASRYMRSFSPIDMARGLPSGPRLQYSPRLLAQASYSRAEEGGDWALTTTALGLWKCPMMQHCSCRPCRNSRLVPDWRASSEKEVCPFGACLTADRIVQWGIIPAPQREHQVNLTSTNWSASSKHTD